MHKAVNRHELDPCTFLQRSAVAYGSRTAVITTKGKKITYRELLARVHRLVGAIDSLNLPPGSRIAYLCYNTLELFEAHYGVLAAGHIIVAINTRLAGDEIQYILQHSGAALLVTDPSLKAKVQGVDIKTIETGNEYEKWIQGCHGAGHWEQDEDAVVSICYTSGTTGQPKGVMTTRRGAYLAALANAMHARLDYNSAYLWTVPLFHCNGWTFVWSTVAAGAVNVMLDKMDYGLIWRHLKDGVTHYNAAPTVQLEIVNHKDAQPLDKEVRAMVAGAPPSPTLLQKMSQLGLQAVHVYGLTETYGPSTINETGADPEKQARQGVVYVTAGQSDVVDADGKPVPWDGQTLGEVVFRGNLVMAGYYREEAATQRAFKGGWFHSGDLAVVHPDGNIELRDRAKDIIISGGENISTIQVENCIAKHPKVVECAVVGYQDPKWGERPRAFVVAKDLTAAELKDWCRAQLAAYKVPSDFVFTESLPKTGTGKIQKFILRSKL